MYPLLYKYLMLNEEVCIPGLGRFFKQRTPARHDFLNKVFQPPVYTIAFHEEPVKADKQFYAFLGNEKGINAVEAIRHYHDFAYRLNDHIRQYSQTDLPGLGVLKKSSDGRLEWLPQDLLVNYFPATPAERILRTDAQHDLLVGDTATNSTEMQEQLEETEKRSRSHWWIIAVGVALIAIAAIVYYYLQHGNIRF